MKTSSSKKFSTVLGLGAFVLAGPGLAETPAPDAIHFRIPSQPIGEALNAFAEQSGLQLLFRSELGAGVTAPAVQGVLSAQQALELLLAQSGLKYEFINPHTVTVRSPDEATRSGKEGRRGPFVVAQAGGTNPSRASLSIHPTNDDADGTLAEIIVVGTLLRDTTPTSPVVSFTRSDIERGGYMNVQDLLAKTPQNFSGAAARSGGNAGFSSQANIRGLGPEATLTLVDGRRVTSGAGDDGRAVDLSMIPASAIERIDILTDGASALYGSDAVAGVINIVLRDNFQGAETAVHYGADEAGREDVQFSQVLGTAWDSGRVLAAAEYGRMDSVRMRDVGVESVDFSARGGGNYRRAFIGSPGTVLPAGFFAGAPFTTLTGPGATPVFFATLPSGDGRALDLAELGLNQSTSADLYAEDLTPRTENASVYVTAEQDIGSVTAFIDGVFARREVLFKGANNGDILYVPATNAYSPFDEDVMVGYELTELGPSALFNRKDGWFVNLGARGELGFADWTWEIVATQSQDETATRGSIPDFGGLAMRLASPDPTIAFNPFGDGSGQAPGVVDALRDVIAYDAQATLRNIAVQSQGRLFDAPGGAARLAIGGEYREEDLRSSAAGGGQAFDYYPGAKRDVSAVFAEINVPLIDAVNARPAMRELTLSMAARHERYSDFGETTNPKVGVLWRPLEDVTLKASWGTSFRAPLLRELAFISRFAPNLPVFDTRAPGGPANVFTDVIIGGNPDLQEETAETWAVGAEYRPAWLEGAHASLGYFRTDYEDRIRGFLDGLDFTTLLQFEDSLPPGFIVRAADGSLELIRNANLNSARALMSGYDATVGYGWRTQGYGAFDLSANATILDRYDDQLIAGAPVLDLRGRVANPPRWRGRAHLSWSRDGWNALVSVNHVDSLRNDSPDPRIVRRDVGSQTTVDCQISFAPRGAESPWLHGVTWRLGANNLFDENAPFVDSPDQLGVDAQNFVFRGRTIYLRISKAFGSAAP